MKYMDTEDLDIAPVVVSTGSSGRRVKVPSSESPLETQTPGFRAVHRESILSTLQ